jgi:hypothetical protein
MFVISAILLYREKLLPVNKFTGLVVPSARPGWWFQYAVTLDQLVVPVQRPGSFRTDVVSCEVIACDVPLEGSLSLELYYIERREIYTG